MANELVQIVLRARDEATAKIRVVNGELGALTKFSGRVLGAAGPYGALAAAAVTAGVAIVALARKAVDSADEQYRAAAAAGVAGEQIARERNRVEELGGELALLNYRWNTFVQSVQKGSVGLASTPIKVINDTITDLNRELPTTIQHWREILALSSKGVPFVQAIGIQEARSKALEASGSPFQPPTTELGPTGAVAPSTVENDPENERRGAVRDAQRRARAAALREIQTLLGLGRAKAIEYQQALDRITNLRAAQKLGEAIFEATGEDVLSRPTTGILEATGGTIPTFPKRQMPTVDQPVAFDFEKRNAEIQKWLTSMPKVQSDIAAIALEMRAANEQALSSLEITRGAFQAFEGGVHSGFSIVAANLNSEFQTIESAWKTMLNQMQAYYAEFLAQLAAKKLLTVLLGLVPGGGPVAAAAEAFPIAPGGGAPRLPSRPDRARPAARESGNTYIIYAFNTTDAIEQIQSSGGSLRQANDRVMVLRRAGQD